MGKIKLICDSMADLTKEQIEKYDIEVLPLTVILEDKEYKDGIDFNLDEFYELLKNKKYNNYHGVIFFIPATLKKYA